MKEIELSAGTIRYRDNGDGPPLLFVHGFLVDGTLWRKVLPALERRFRCIVPDLPLGSHTLPMKPSADLSPRGLALLIGELIDKLALEDVTLVANDTGGALTQILLAERPDVASKVVLTPCDSFENFLPPEFRPLQYLARVPGAVNVVIQTLRIPILRRLPFAYGWLAKRKLPAELTAAWVKPGQTDKGIRRDIARVLKGVHKRYTVEAAKKLPQFKGEALIAWAPEDRFFPIEHARKLGELFPNARVVEISDSRTYVPEDQPERLVQLIEEFAGASATRASEETRAAR